MRLLTVEIRGLNSEERWKQARALLGDRQMHLNAPMVLVDFLRREDAHLAMLNLNLIPGIAAEIVGDQPSQSQRTKI